MFFQWWRSLQKHGFVSARPARQPKAVSRRRYRLTLEALEARAVPTVTAISQAAGPNAPSVTPTGQSGNPALSSDGRFVAFQSTAPDIVPGQSDLNGANDIFVYDRVLRTTTLVSHSYLAGNIAANGASTNPSISGDGRYITFQSTATDLQNGIQHVPRNNNNDVYLYDRTTGVNSLVSRDNFGGPVISTGDGASFNPVLSAGGGFITFVSEADDLATGGEVIPPQVLTNVFLYDRVAGTIALVSHDSASTTSPFQAGDGPSSNPVISNDGLYVAYQSTASDLVAGQIEVGLPTSQVFLYNRLSRGNTLVSHNASSALQVSNGASTNPTLSSDGSFIAYQSLGTDLIVGQVDLNQGTDVFLYNRVQGTTFLVSYASTDAATTANGASDQPALSGNGQFLAYRSLATNLVAGQQDLNGASNVFLFDVAAGTTTLASHLVGAPVVTGDGASSSPVLSADGNTLVLLSTSTNLIGGETELDSGTDVFAFSRLTGQVRLVSTALGFPAVTGNGPSDQLAISSDGTFIAFRSAASNLIAGDLNGQPDVFGFVNHIDALVGEDAATGQQFVSLSNGSAFLPQVLGTTWAPTPTLVDELVGDFNGDGRQDLAVRDSSSGAWFVALADGHGGFLPAQLWDRWTPGGANVWTDVQVGHFDGSGRAEIVGRHKPSGQWWVDLSTGTQFVARFWTAWAADSQALHWVDVHVGDLTGNGLDDLVGRVRESGEWWVGLSTGSSFRNVKWTTWNPTVTWVDVHLGDLTGNGKADIVGRVLESGQWWAGISDGLGFTNSLWAVWSTAVTWVDVQFGDFNGDGKLDVAGRVLQNGRWWVGTSTGHSFNNTSLWMAWAQTPGITWVDVQSGDFTGSGFTDIIGRVLETGEWFVAVPNGSSAFTVTQWTAWSPDVTWIGVKHGAFA
jgi:hypothetical protein